jgi:hypothetical protein
MTERDYTSKLEELDRLLNDPEVAMEPSKVWSLLAEVSQHDTAVLAQVSIAPTSSMMFRSSKSARRSMFVSLPSKT